jgi:Flp pilus assembly protein TadG
VVEGTLGNSSGLAISMLKQFLRDRRGNYAMIGAVASIPLVGAMALAVDFSEWTRQKQSLLNSLDAAGIATARHFMSGATEAESKAYAEQFFRANIGSARQYETTLKATIPTVANPRDDVELTATIKYKPIIYPKFRSLIGLTGGDTIDFSATSRVKVQNTLEVALVLDNSGSMDEYGTGSSKKRITVLKEAAAALVTSLAGRAAVMKKVDAPVKFALVPFAASVNVGPDYDDAEWMDTDGISPVHHENFNWPVTIATNKEIKWQDGAWRKIGSAWPAAERTTIFTRFSLYQDLKRYKYSSGTTTDPAATWQGCVEARPDPYNSNGAPAVQSDPASLIVPMFAPDEHDSLTYNGYTYRSDNNWWTDITSKGSYSGAQNKTAQRDMKKYFTPAPYGSSSVSGLNIGPNNNCTTSPITPLTDVSTQAGVDFIKTKINLMAPLGGTDVPEGMAWGWHLVSSAPPFTDGRSETENGNDKVVIVLTDGQNTYYPANYSDLAGNKSDYSAYGYVGQTYNGSSDTRLFKNTTTPVSKTTHTVDNYGLALDQHFKRLCDNAKAGNVMVMTIALDLNDTGTVLTNPEKRQIELLRDCASFSKFRRNTDGSKVKLFWNSKSSTLADDFKALGEELSNLRIVG